MIEKFVKAWDENNKLLLKEFENNEPVNYKDIVKKLVTIVINPYLEKNRFDSDFPNYSLDIDNMTIIDNGDYQGTNIYIIPFDTYQPDTSNYVFTYNEYGSCTGCDTFYHIRDDYNTKEEKAKRFHTLALHILQRFKQLDDNFKHLDDDIL